MHFTNLFTVVAGTLATLYVASTPVSAAQVGTKCDGEKDLFACVGSEFLQCNTDTGKWILQNTCTQNCKKDPVFKSFCTKSTNTLTKVDKPKKTKAPKANKTKAQKATKTRAVKPKKAKGPKATKAPKA